MIAPAAFCARDFASASLELDLARVGGVVFDVFLVPAKGVSAAGGSSGGGGLGGVCRHGSGGGEKTREAGRGQARECEQGA